MKNVRLFQVIGFHHSGTSILRKIIGNHREVFDVLNEGLASEAAKELTPDQSKTVSAVVAKSVAYGPNFHNNTTSADRCILTIRNPLDTMASLLLRYPNIEITQQFRNWEAYGLKYLEMNTSNLMKVSYESLFSPQFKTLREIFSFLKIEWTDSVVADVVLRRTPIHYPNVPDEEPRRIDHEAFRSWQINQPFQLMNGRNREVLPAAFMEEILNSEVTKQLNYAG